MSNAPSLPCLESARVEPFSMPTSSQKRRDRRLRAFRKQQEAEALARVSGSIVGYGDGRHVFVLTRRDERLELRPSPEIPRRDIFVYWPRTTAIRGLTLLAQSCGWRVDSVHRVVE